MLDFKKEFQKFLHEEHAVYTNRDDSVLLIDGMNIYCRAFAASPQMNGDGTHIGGTTSFLKSIAACIRLIKPSRCVIVFDGAGGSQRRRAIYKEYKANRRSMTSLNRSYDFQTLEEEHEQRKKQLLVVIELLQYLPVTVIAQDNVEADDVIAYFAGIIQDRGGKSVIMSTDRDFLQLINDTRRCYNPAKKKIYDAEAVVGEYQVHPANFLVYRVLDGDKSDNIDGVKGMGLKTLIKHFPLVANSDPLTWPMIYEQCASSTTKALQAILTHQVTIERNMALMRLDDPQMSGHAKLTVLNQFDGPIPAFSKYNLTKALVSFNMISAFTHYDEWLRNSFNLLMQFSAKEMQ